MTDNNSENKVLATPYQKLIYKRTYARFLDKEHRRETWDETVDRYADFFSDRLLIPRSFKNDDFRYRKIDEFWDAIDSLSKLDVVGSMRAFWTAGKALDYDNACGYNCAYMVIDSVKSFGELMYLLMCGTGVGFSVEQEHVNKLPRIPDSFEPVNINVIFDDSREGWKEGLEFYMSFLYQGRVPECDFSRLRPKGARLKTFGGRSSGPEPLMKLIDIVTDIFVKAKGRRLTPLECYDICCHISSVIVVGGVRRSASIALIDYDDEELFNAKEGSFYVDNPQRCFANNSVVFNEKPTWDVLQKYWTAYTSGNSGEPGIFNRQAVTALAVKSGRDHNKAYGCNPCGEIILGDRGFCNLTEVIIRPFDQLVDIYKKVKHAVILGVLQSTLTKFPFLSKEWKENCEQERLLGVSLTGLRDNMHFSHVTNDTKRHLKCMKRYARRIANEWADYLGINRPKAVTCVKPSGTVSKLVDCASGLHPRYAQFYIQRVRIAATDPLCKFLIDKGVPWNPEVGEKAEEYTTAVFDFPIKSPLGAVLVESVDAIEQLEYWKMLQECWCDHKPSCTIYVKPEEWEDVVQWVHWNWDIMSGVTFFPSTGAVYDLAPYEEITEQEYWKLNAEFPDLNFKDFIKYEHEDNTTGSKEYACQGGGCEI